MKSPVPKQDEQTPTTQGSVQHIHVDTISGGSVDKEINEQLYIYICIHTRTYMSVCVCVCVCRSVSPPLSHSLHRPSGASVSQVASGHALILQAFYDTYV